MAGSTRLHGLGTPETPEELRRVQNIAELRLELYAAEEVGVESTRDLRQRHRRIRRLSRELRELIEARVKSEHDADAAGRRRRGRAWREAMRSG